MSVRLMTQVWDIPLPCAQKLVLLKLADNAHDDGLSARPGVSAIARQCGLSERSVQCALKELRDSGLIVATQFATGGRGHVTEYRICLAVAAERVQILRMPLSLKGADPALKGADFAKSDTPSKEVVFMNRQEPYSVGGAAPSAPPKTGTSSKAKGNGNPQVQNLLVYYIDQCRESGYEPLRSSIPHMIRQITKLIAEKDYDLVRAALRVAADERKTPQALPLVLLDIEAGRNGHGKA